jgi:hypothetical protein
VWEILMSCNEVLVTLNQRVQGSSPGAPTIDFTRLSSLHNKSI